MSCGCNVFNEYPSGGLIAGGSAVIYLETVEGGCIAGGSARVEVYQDAYDGLEFILPLDESGNVYFDRTKNQLV